MTTLPSPDAPQRDLHRRAFLLYQFASAPDTLADLKRSVRNSLSYFQTVRTRIESMMAGCYAPKANATPSPGV